VYKVWRRKSRTKSHSRGTTAEGVRILFLGGRPGQDKFRGITNQFPFVRQGPDSRDQRERGTSPFCTHRVFPSLEERVRTGGRDQLEGPGPRGEMASRNSHNRGSATSGPGEETRQKRTTSPNPSSHVRPGSPGQKT